MNLLLSNSKPAVFISAPLDVEGKKAKGKAVFVKWGKNRQQKEICRFKKLSTPSKTTETIKTLFQFYLSFR